jgi:hypothetical protein
MSSIAVTIAAITNTKMGNRISLGITFRSAETVTFEQTKVIVVASPNPKLFIKVLLTANNGHNPNKATKA